MNQGTYFDVEWWLALGQFIILVACFAVVWRELRAADKHWTDEDLESAVHKRRNRTADFTRREMNALKAVGLWPK